MSLDVYLEMDLDVGNEDPYPAELFTGNITHNLAPMAENCGLYKPIWRPEENNMVTGADMIDPLKDGLELLRSDRDRFEEFNPENGWGDYDGFVKFVEEYLQACLNFPKAKINVWR